jgi:hypothetical protein
MDTSPVERGGTKMMIHPDLLLALESAHHRELIAEADRGRLLGGARLTRKGRRAAKVAGGRGQPAGTLASCEPSVVVPAR